MTSLIYSPIIFIGREKELDLVEMMLAASQSEEWILNIYGEGGIGKTQLLNRFAEWAIESRAGGRNILSTRTPIDLYLTTHQVEVGILKSIADQLDPVLFAPFYSAIDQYRNSPDTISLLRDSFREVYRSLTAEHILLLFDTTETASDGAKRFFKEMLPTLQEASNNRTIAIVAGRQPLTPLFPDRTVRELTLTGFSQAEMQTYLENQQIDIPSEHIERLAQLSNGKPILIALIVDWLNFGHSLEELVDYDKDDFERVMVERVAQLRFPEDHVILAMAHFYRRFNEDILISVFDETRESATELTESLSRFSFIKYRPPIDGQVGSCLLHDEMRHLIGKYIWPTFDPLGSFRREWSRKIVDYYAKQIEEERNLIEKNSLEKECLFYALDADLNKGFDYWNKLFRGAPDPDIKESINLELRYYEYRLSPEMRRKLEFRRAEILYYRSQYTSYFQKIETLMSDDECELDLLATIRADLVAAYARSGDVPVAITHGLQSEIWFQCTLGNTSIEQSLHNDINREFGRLLNHLGYAYRGQNSLRESIAYYTKATRMLEAVAGAAQFIASILNNLSYVYHLSGEYSKAIGVCKRSIRIKQRGDNPYQLGLSYNVLGIIEADWWRDELAIDYFKRALHEFERAKSARGKVLVYIAYGRLLREQGSRRYEGVPSRDIQEKQPVEYAKASEMLDEAIRIAAGTDSSSLADAFNEKGALFRQQGYWDEAIIYFEYSKDLAKKVNNLYRVADNLQHIGFTYYLQGEFEKSLNASQEACDFTEEINAPLLTARAQRTIARIQFIHGNYDVAFEEASNACINTVKNNPGSSYNTPVKIFNLYEQMLDWLIDGLLDRLPSRELLEEKSNYLIQRWEAEEIEGISLKDMYPSFIERIRDLTLF